MGRPKGSTKGISKSTEVKREVSMPVVHSYAAGIDVGSRSHFVAIGQGSDGVKEFGVYSEDLHELCKWLKAAGIETVALESTGTYWQNLFLLLQDYALNPILVNGRLPKMCREKRRMCKIVNGFRKCTQWVCYPIASNPTTLRRNYVNIRDIANI